MACPNVLNLVGVCKGKNKLFKFRMPRKTHQIPPPFSQGLNECSSKWNRMEQRVAVLSRTSSFWIHYPSVLLGLPAQTPNPTPYLYCFYWFLPSQALCSTTRIIIAFKRVICVNTVLSSSAKDALIKNVPEPLASFPHVRRLTESHCFLYIGEWKRNNQARS